VSFPRLFTRLVETTTTTLLTKGKGGTPYTEFRTILMGMMEAYRAEGDMLVITKHLLDRDVFETIEMAARARARGWAPLAGTCAGCGLPLMPPKELGAGNGAPQVRARARAQVGTGVRGRGRVR